MQGISAKLDWNRMLGFEQIVDERANIGRSAKFDAKVGGKPLRVGAKVGGKPIEEFRVGAKIGGKPGIKPRT